MRHGEQCHGYPYPPSPLMVLPPFPLVAVHERVSDVDGVGPLVESAGSQLVDGTVWASG